MATACEASQVVSMLERFMEEIVLAEGGRCCAFANFLALSALVLFYEACITYVKYQRYRTDFPDSGAVACPRYI